jgi:[protein-PII] uridylyltransferase
LDSGHKKDLVPARAGMGNTGALESQTQPNGEIAATLQSSAQWQRIEREFLATGRPSIVLAGLTQATDEIVIQAWHSVVEPAVGQPAAMFAVGAYGRGETFPYSGADLLVLLDSARHTQSVKASLDAFARQLWDAGLRLNYTVRTLAECLDTQNLDLTVSLLDRRFLAGDRSLDSRLDARLPAMLERHAPKIREYICQSALDRHAKFRNKCCLLEPDVKESPGGLRDLRAIDRLTNREPLGRPAGYEGHLQRNEALKDAGVFFASARSFLHYHFRRDCNLLNFEGRESLERLALIRGVTPDDWMREYYRHARFVFREARRALETAGKSNSSLLENFLEYRTRLSNAEFTVSRERLLLRSPAHLETDPGLIFRMLEFISRHGVPAAAETERRLAAAASAFAAQCAQPRPSWPAIRDILAGPHAPMALRALEGAGLLTALFPEWAAVEDLPVQPEHCYTADEHTLCAIECINALPSEADPTRRRFSGLFAEIDNPAVLLFAILFHQAGTGRARPVMARMEMPQEDQVAVEFLLDHQRDLADTMGGRDLQDPATVRSLASRVGTIERLKSLTLLTFAGISAANPDGAPAWRLEQLWRAYTLTQQELTRELETDRIQQPPADLPGNAEFLAGFPVRYLRSHLPAEIQAHLQQYELSRPTGVAVRMDEMEGAYRLTIVARDRPRLFASFAGAISSFGLEILKAEAYSNARGVILDTFVFADPSRMLQFNPSEGERLCDLIQRVAVGKTVVERLMRNRPRPEPRKASQPPQIRFDSEACDTATLVEINADDRPGLLYSLATAISSSNCNIDVVLIDTKGHRAIDVFYVAHLGRKLPPDVQECLKDNLLAAC